MDIQCCYRTSNEVFQSWLGIKTIMVVGRGWTVTVWPHPEDVLTMTLVRRGRVYLLSEADPANVHR